VGGLRTWPVVALASCRFSSPTVGPVDGSAADGPATPTVDAAMLGPWGTPQPVTGLSDPADDDDPTLTADLLEIYFDSGRPGGKGGADIWKSVRTSTSSPWQTPTPVAELNSSSLDSTPKVSPDGLTMYLNSDRGGGAGGSDIYVSTRSGRDQPWSPPVQIAELATASDDFGASTDPAQRRMIFNSNRGGGGEDLYETTRMSSTQPWGPPIELDNVNTTANDLSPYLTADDLVVYFHSDRPGLGQSDIYVATRTSIGTAFDAAVRIDEVSSSADDTDPWVSADGHTMFFASTRSGNSEIYEAKR
jgi:Tol biopolymer transport system component